MPTKLDAKKAAEAVQEKQQLEVMLAWELLEVFNTTPALVGPLRDCADLALQEMIAIRDGVPKDGPAVIAEAIKDEIGVISILKKERAKSKIKDDLKFEGGQVDTPAKFNVLLKEVQKMDCQEVSELIRLYGTFVEKAAKNPALKAFYEEVDKKKSSFRKGTEKFDAKAVWNQGKDGEKAGRHRATVLSDEWKNIVKGLSENPKVKPNEILDLTVEFLAEASFEFEKTSRGAVQNFLVSMEGGQRLFALKDTSTIGKLDHAFGLVPASDISGTTTDTIFFFGKFPKIDPIFQVLPLATIVAGAHHSLIEVALPLSMNKLCDYHIGFYTTLLPTSKHAAVAAIKKVLEKAEKEPLNRFLLVWYSKDGKAIEGAYEFKPSEKKQFDAFKAFARAQDVQATLAKAKAVDSALIEELMTKHGLK